MIKISLTTEEIEKIFKKLITIQNPTVEKPLNISWRYFYLTLLMDSASENFYCLEEGIKKIFNIPIKLGYFSVNFYDPNNEHYLLIKDCFNSQTELFSQQELDNNTELKEQYEIFKKWENETDSKYFYTILNNLD